jgi:hypothetical protein
VKEYQFSCFECSIIESRESFETFPLEFNNEAHSRGAEIKRNIGVKGRIPRNVPV